MKIESYIDFASKLYLIKNYIQMKSKLSYLALFFIIPCFAFYGNEHEANWLWTNLTWVPVVLVFISLVCVALHIYLKKKQNDQFI